MGPLPGDTSVPTTTPVRDFRARQRDARRRDAQARFNAVAEDPLHDARVGSDKWRLGKEAVMKEWKMFVQDSCVGSNPDDIWLGLCRSEKDAVTYCRLFLEDYVRYSERPVICLGPEETKLERSVKAAYSVESIWKTLVLAANDTVLAEKRRADPNNASQWTLRYPTKDSTRLDAVWQIRYWIGTTLSQRFGLTLEQSFVKAGATDRDIILFLRTLWTRAKDIPCSRRVRVAMHSIILLAGIGGFRPGTLFQLSYSQVQLAVVRDPSTQTRKLVAEVTIRQNKVKKDVVLKSQKETISFAVAPIPYSLCCLSTLLFAAAVSDEAFETPFTSFEELLQRPDLENVDYIPLPWKPGMERRQILPVTYHVGWPIWNRTLEVAGLREPVRFYSTRVGAGGRLDGALTEALRNYVLSNSTAVFQRSYQQRHLAADLARIAFGNRAGNNERLFESLRDLSLRGDASAPIYPTAAELKAFEGREDMRALRAAYGKLKRDTSSEAKKEANRVQSRIGKLVRELCALKVQEKRREYFRQVDSRRAAGLSTANLQVPAINPRTTPFDKDALPAMGVGQVLCEADAGGGRHLSGDPSSISCGGGMKSWSHVWTGSPSQTSARYRRRRWPFRNPRIARPLPASCAERNSVCGNLSRSTIPGFITDEDASSSPSTALPAAKPSLSMMLCIGATTSKLPTAKITPLSLPKTPFLCRGRPTQVLHWNVQNPPAFCAERHSVRGAI
ncbi:hypothetical protein RB600_009869 [Gaeumannomyces tritici]